MYIKYSEFTKNTHADAVTGVDCVQQTYLIKYNH